MQTLCSAAFARWRVQSDQDGTKEYLESLQPGATAAQQLRHSGLCLGVAVLPSSEAAEKTEG